MARDTKELASAGLMRPLRVISRGGKEGLEKERLGEPKLI
jgi:hypothetical protein